MAPDYENVIVETYNCSARGRIRVRPVEGGKYDRSINVECSRKMRKLYPVGTKFLLQAVLTDRDDGGQFLYSHYNWPYEVIS